MLLTHRLFFSASELAELLERRLATPAAVLSLAAQWLQRLPVSAAEARQPLARLLKKMAGTGDSDHGCAAAANRLLRELEGETIPESPASGDDRAVASLEAIEAEEFAEQLTALSHSVFRRIPPHELLCQRWLGPDKFMLAPNVTGCVCFVSV